MRAIEFGGNLHRQLAARKRLGGERGVGSRGKKISAKRKKYFYGARVHGLNGFNRAVTVLLRRREMKFFSQAAQKFRRGSLPNSHGAITLHIAVATHRTRARARLSKMSAQQKKIDNFLNVANGVAMLRKTHGPATNQGLAVGDDLRHFANLRL